MPLTSVRRRFFVCLAWWRSIFSYKTNDLYADRFDHVGFGATQYCQRVEWQGMVDHDTAVCRLTPDKNDFRKMA